MATLKFFPNQNNFKIVVSGMQQHINALNKEESFSSYESAVDYFQTMCEKALGECPEVCHTPSNECELSEGGIGYDYRVTLEFHNEENQD